MALADQEMPGATTRAYHHFRIGTTPKPGEGVRYTESSSSAAMGVQTGATHEGLRTYFQGGQPRRLIYSSAGSPSEDCTNL
jgi:hypothetical protein